MVPVNAVFVRAKNHGEVMLVNASFQLILVILQMSSTEKYVLGEVYVNVVFANAIVPTKLNIQAASVKNVR